MARLLGDLLVLALLGGLLFGLAGRWDLPVYWGYMGVLLALGLGAGAGVDRDLVRERRRPGPGGEDFLLLHVAKIVLLGHFLLAPLDAGRLHWSDGVPTWLQWTGLGFFAAGFAVVLWGMIVNRYFSSVVRLQDDRGHVVITSGPYRFVRHPGYTGMLVGMLGSGLALNSWLSILIVLPFHVLIVRRTLIEDRFLIDKLEGYDDYADRVRYRLVPGVW